MDLPFQDIVLRGNHTLCLASFSFPGSVLLFIKEETVAQTDTVTIQSHLATKSQAPTQCPFKGLSLGFVVWGAAGNGKFHTPSDGHHNSAVTVFCCLERGRMWSQHCLILTLANNGKNNSS